MVDYQVRATQQWLNSTYGAVTGWVHLNEDGVTGWNTIYGLRRGLQAELGISPVTSGFGPQTTANFKSQIGRIDASSNLSSNLWMLLSGSLWCKGFAGLYGGQTPGFTPLSASITVIRSDLGLTPDPPFVDVKLMAFLLSMDACVLISGGSSSIRTVQQWLNATYLWRADFTVNPCDGIYSRAVQTALLYGLQYELGLDDGVANGAFGPTTKRELAAQGIVGPGSSDVSKRFVHLFQGACRFNGLSVPFDGSFASSTQIPLEDFQTFMEIPKTGKGDYTTWCNLLVSCGDVTLPTKGFDTATPLTGGRAAGASSLGYTHAGRYLVGTTKFISAAELDDLRAAGLRLFPIQQRSNNSVGAMTYSDGWAQGVEAIKRARVLGLPANSTIFFAVDFDPEGDVIDGPVLDFFKGVNDAIEMARSYSFKVGVYGTRNVCSKMIGADKAVAAFVSGMSYGYSGNMGFAMPAEWHYNQVVGASEPFGGGSKTDIDHDKVSSRASSVDLSTVVTPPVEHDGSATATGFDVAFEWVVGAEVACEQAIREADSALTPTAPYVASISDYVLDWLRKPTYWGTSEQALWPKYTPVVNTNNNEALARQATVDALGLLAPTKPQSSRDTAHWAATTLGYRIWGGADDPATYGVGDLGGWLLDLLQAFGVWYGISPQPALDTWMTANIGTTDSSGFGFNDLVADADAWLVAKAMAGVSRPVLSDAMRGVYKLTPTQRLAKFYTERFARSADKVAAHFQQLVDGIDLGTIPIPFSTYLLLLAADTDVLPTQQQADTCGRAVAAFLARQS